ncbi:MAG: hypothetical protein C4292_03960 [Nitrososphaera sp.]
MSGESWSEWLDFDRAGVEKVPEAPGVWLMHASMKVMHIGSADNMRLALLQLLSDPCAGKARRFHYMLSASHVQAKEQLIRDYKEKHGKMPACMEP